MNEKEQLEANQKKRIELQGKRMEFPEFVFTTTDTSAIEAEREKAIADSADNPSLAERVAIISTYTDALIEIRLADADRHRKSVELYENALLSHQQWIDAELVALDADDDRLDELIRQNIRDTMDTNSSNDETPTQEKDGVIDHTLLSGFGEVKQKQLADAGIVRWSDLARLTIQDINAIIKPDASLPKVQSWIEFAKKMLK